MEESEWVSGVPPEIRPAFITAVVVVILLIVVAYCLYINNLRALLKAVKPEHRKMVPRSVWLLLFGFLWFPAVWNYVEDSDKTLVYSVIEILLLFFPVAFQLFITLKISKSVAASFYTPGAVAVSGPGLLFGLLYIIGAFIFTVGNMLPAWPFLDYFMPVMLLLTFIFWIAYWVQTAKYKKQLRTLALQSATESLVFGNLF